MKSMENWSVKTVRWSGWPLLALTIGFLITGYIMSGSFGLGIWMNEKKALAFHKLFHIPLVLLLVLHVIPAAYLALIRWGWIRKPTNR